MGHAGAQTIFRNLSTLSSKQVKIKLICFINQSERLLVNDLVRHGIDVQYIVFNRNKKKIFPKDWIKILKALIRAVTRLEPIYVAKYYNSNMKALIGKNIKDFHPDVIQFEYNMMNAYSNLTGDIPLVISEHDVSTKLFERIYRESKTVWAKLKNWYRFIFWNWYEPRMLKKFNSVLTVTKEDLDYALNWEGMPPLHAIPPPVSVKISEPSNKISNQLCFVGSFNRKPNIQTANILLNKVFPRLKEQNSKLTLRIAGKHLPNTLIDRCNSIKDLFYDGFVDDIDEYIASSQLFVAPIYIGAGLKMKVTHSLACGTPVITTTVGSEGIPFSEKEGLWVIDELSDFIDQCSILINDQTRLNQVGEIGREKVVDYFSCDRISDQLLEIYTNLKQ